MAIFTRFECPRCQHVFVQEGVDDAFADCPKCQSMALAIGEASSAGAPPAPKPQVSLASDEDAPFHRTASGESEPGNKGVFSQLLDSTSEFSIDVTNDDMRVPATLEELEVVKPKAARPAPAPFDESTAVGELPPSLMLTRMSPREAPTMPPSDPEGFDPFAGVPGVSDEDDVHRAPTALLRPQATDQLNAFSSGELERAFDNQIDEDAWENGPPATVPTRNSADSLPRPPSTNEMKFKRQSASGNPALELTRTDSPPAGQRPLISEEFSLELHEEPSQRSVGPGQRRGVWDPAFNSGEIKPGAMLLSDLEAQFQGGVSLDQAAGSLSMREMSALEAALGQMAGAPAPAPLPLDRRAEDALRQASFDAAHSMLTVPTSSQLQGTAVPAPPAADEPPALRRRKRAGHLTLSDEAKALAAIPIQPAAGSHNLALELTRGTGPKPRDVEDGPSPSRTLPELVPEEPPRARPHLAAVEHVEVTDEVPVRERPGRAPAQRRAPAEPTTFQGFTFLRIAALVVVFLVLGGGAGAALAPEPERKPMTARSRAEQQFAQGNKFYAEGRYDDALGSYRGAIAVDRTFALAHRAKAVALAKQSRHDEAAGAYRAYLEMSPSAVDAEEVRALLRRYEGDAK